MHYSDGSEADTLKCSILVIFVRHIGQSLWFVSHWAKAVLSKIWKQSLIREMVWQSLRSVMVIGHWVPLAASAEAWFLYTKCGISCLTCGLWASSSPLEEESESDSDSESELLDPNRMLSKAIWFLTSCLSVSAIIRFLKGGTRPGSQLVCIENSTGYKLPK